MSGNDPFFKKTSLNQIHRHQDYYTDIINGTTFSYTADQKPMIPHKVQCPLPSIGLELYQLGVHTRAKKES